ncbi:MAG: TIGR01212 family radical SAM protein [Planctomycetales bacterium]|nr:TIGR01212 family radical SAM protein [Planctomycetales bacterium]MBN8627636.1 TIGR01212 family radical SAM protein [Planctomycetota bacterium]
MNPTVSHLQTQAVREAQGWRAAGLRYFSYNYFLRQLYGRRIHKVSVDAGFTCPNVDGTVTTGGCVFCDNRSFSPSRRLPRNGIGGQIAEQIKRIKFRYKVDDFIAYFQPATNTYAPVAKLRRLYEEALAQPKIVGMAIGTRPDSVPPDVLDLISELAERHYVSLEYGMQSMHDRSLVWMNRGHDHASFLDAVERSRGRGFEICAHVILGTPGETHDDMLATAREIARLNIDAVKLHNLYAVKGTPLADQVEAGQVTLMERDEYVRTVVDILEILPPTMVVERVSGESPPNYHLGPAWCLDKPGLKAALEAEFERRDTYQGRCYSAV